MEITKKIVTELLKERFNSDAIDIIDTLSDGYAKRTFKLSIDNEYFLLQIWDEPDHLLTKSEQEESENDFPGSIENFIKAKEILSSLHVKTPEIVYADQSGIRLPFDYAVVQYISGGTLFDNPLKFSDNAFVSDLGKTFGKINRIQRDSPGLITGKGKSFDCINSMLKKNITHLAIGAQYNQFLDRNSSGIKQCLEQIAGEIVSRNYFSLIHGDFKPNHVMFDESGDTILIDCDGMHYFDVEYEIAQFMIPTFAFSNTPAFLKSYFDVSQRVVDQKRLLFYKTCHAISGICFCSEYLNKYNKLDGLSEKVIKSNEESIRTELLNRLH